MASKLNTNKQFMIGNGLLAFAVIIVVVIFSYMAMKMQQEKKLHRTFTEEYTIKLDKSFAGDTIAIQINDSLIFKGEIDSTLTKKVQRFAKQSAIAIVQLHDDTSSWFDLSENGGTYQFEKKDNKVVLLPQ